MDPGLRRPPVWLESAEWEGTRLSAQTLDAYEVPASEGFNERLDAANARLFAELRARAGAEAFVVVEAFRGAFDLWS
ncbi:hypothetical protein HNP84_008488 [Thermocatellispora tengchongensis]|uniref:Uncharacterized protein n=1 Tax=Thermocatellispora tengchongensis TaxID=1073253 RepID=A0A840PM58_9ACTN|nr:hypothetical protein [Thermocatellispora tengchongensis]MBB5138730.1 hypothetical protein [Thermocatellispora tengchongensis]